MLGAASSQFANLVRAMRAVPRAGPRPRPGLPAAAADVRRRARGPPAARCGCSANGSVGGGPDGDAPWRAEVFAVLATAAAIAGRNDDVGPLAAAVVDDPASSDVALALADRAWGLACRAADPIAAARHFDLAGGAAERAGFASMALEVRAFEAGELDVAGDRRRALDLLADVVRRGSRPTDDVFVVVLAHLVRSRVMLRAGDVDDAAAELAAAEAASAAMGQPWWTAAILRTAAAVASLGPGGWAASTARWRQAVDFAASHGALGEVAITLRTAASVAQHLGEHEQAAVLFAAVPRSSAITVLPELFPDAMAELEAAAPARPVGLHLVDALQRARAALDASTAAHAGAGAAERPPSRPHRRVAELVVEGESWRVGFAGRTVRVRDMKGDRRPRRPPRPARRRGARARADGRSGRRRGGRSGARRTGPAGVPGPHRRAATRHRRRPGRQRPRSGRAGRAGAGRARRAAQRGVRARRAGPCHGIQRRAGADGGDLPGARRRSAGWPSCTRSSAGTSATPCAPARGARTGRSTTSSGRSSAAGSQCEVSPHVSRSGPRDQERPMTTTDPRPGHPRQPDVGRPGHRSSCTTGRSTASCGSTPTPSTWPPSWPVRTRRRRWPTR